MRYFTWVHDGTPIIAPKVDVPPVLRGHQSLGGVIGGVLLVGHNRKETESARVPTRRLKCVLAVVELLNWGW